MNVQTPKRMRRLHPEIRAWKVSRSSVSGVMVNSKWNLIQYKMQGILCQHLVCFAYCSLFGPQERCVSLWGGHVPLSCVPSVLSAGEAGADFEQPREVWGNWSCCSWEPGGQDYLMEEGMMGSGMKGILLTWGLPSIQREAVGNPAKEDLVVHQFSTFLLLGVEYKCCCCCFFFLCPSLQ